MRIAWLHEDFNLFALQHLTSWDISHSFWWNLVRMLYFGKIQS